MLWIVGRSSASLEKYLQRHKITYGLFADPKYIADTRAKFVVPLDFKKSLEPQLASRRQLDVSGLLTAGYENYVLPAAHLAAYFKVPGLPLAAAIAATDKAVMRQHFSEHNPKLTPEFAVVKNWSQVETFVDGHALPLMLKPTNLMKSLHVTRNDTVESLRANYLHTTASLDATYRRYHLPMQPRLLIEEFLPGTMHTVAGFVDADGHVTLIPEIVDCIMAADIGVDDTYLFARNLPSSLDQNDQTAVLHVATEGIAALGLRNTPVHVEIIVTKDGPKLIEIGARIGGYRGRMYEYACGLDLYGAAVNCALGKPVSFAKHHAKHCSVIELFPSHEGYFAEITKQAAIKQLPSLEYFSVKVLPGDLVGRAGHGHKAAAVIILLHESADQIAQDFNYIRQNVSVHLQ